MEGYFSLYNGVQRRTKAYNVVRRRTLNVRLPLEHGSDRPQTLGKRVSDDLQLSIFRRQKIFGKIFGFGSQFFIVFGRFLRS